MRDDFRNELNDLAEYWNQIEERLKAAEQIRSETVHAAVNELRYAGRQLIDAWSALFKRNLTEEDEEFISKKIVIAKQYLHNANHDITDAVCFFFHMKIKILLEQYKESRIRKGYPSLDELLNKIDEANSIITASRRTRENRIEN